MGTCRKPDDHNGTSLQVVTVVRFVLTSPYSMGNRVGESGWRMDASEGLDPGPLSLEEVGPRRGAKR